MEELATEKMSQEVQDRKSGSADIDDNLSEGRPVLSEPKVEKRVYVIENLNLPDFTRLRVYSYLDFEMTLEKLALLSK